MVRSERTPIDILQIWVSKNVQADAFQKGHAEAKRLADQLAAAAANRGFSRSSLETVAGSG